MGVRRGNKLGEAPRASPYVAGELNPTVIPAAKALETKPTNHVSEPAELTSIYLNANHLSQPKVGATLGRNILLQTSQVKIIFHLKRYR